MDKLLRKVKDVVKSTRGGRKTDQAEEDAFEDTVSEHEEEQEASGDKYYLPKRRTSTPRNLDKGKERARSRSPAPTKRNRQQKSEATVKEEELEEAEEEAPVPISVPANKKKTKKASGKASGSRNAPHNEDEAIVQITVAQLNAVATRITAFRQEYNTAKDKFETLPISIQALEDASRLVLRYFIFKNSEKPGTPIPRTEITTLITNNITAHRRSNALPGLVIAHARWKLAEAFGLELREISRIPGSRGGGAGGSRSAAAAIAAAQNNPDGPKMFILRTMVPPALVAGYLAQPSDPREAMKSSSYRAFVMVVLSILELQGGKMNESTLWDLLEELGVERGEERHPSLGNVGGLLEEMIRQRYLIAEKVNTEDGVDRGLMIGEVAMDEFGGGEVKEWYEREFAAGGVMEGIEEEEQDE
jgi:hypothetical protein